MAAGWEIQYSSTTSLQEGMRKHCHAGSHNYFHSLAYCLASINGIDTIKLDCNGVDKANAKGIYFGFLNVKL